VKWDLAYGAHGPLALQEYFSRYKTGDMSISPADAKVDSMIDVLTSTADIAAQKKIFFEMEDYMQTELFTLPLYYQ
jgi:ABC-type transport system substrate-binding protein